MSKLNKKIKKHNIFTKKLYTKNNTYFKKL